MVDSDDSASTMAVGNAKIVSISYWLEIDWFVMDSI